MIEVSVCEVDPRVSREKTTDRMRVEYPRRDGEMVGSR